MSIVSTENVLLLVRDLLTSWKSPVGFRASGEGGRNLVQRLVPIKNVTSPVASSKLKCRKQGLGGAMLLD